MSPNREQGSLETVHLSMPSGLVIRFEISRFQAMATSRRSARGCGTGLPSRIKPSMATRTAECQGSQHPITREFLPRHEIGSLATWAAIWLNVSFSSTPEVG
jgi:hypothetical protein